MTSLEPIYSEQFGPEQFGPELTAEGLRTELLYQKFLKLANASSPRPQEESREWMRVGFEFGFLGGGLVLNKGSLGINKTIFERENNL